VGRGREGAVIKALGGDEGGYESQNWYAVVHTWDMS